MKLKLLNFNVQKNWPIRFDGRQFWGNGKKSNVKLQI